MPPNPWPIHTVEVLRLPRTCRDSLTRTLQYSPVQAECGGRSRLIAPMRLGDQAPPDLETILVYRYDTSVARTPLASFHGSNACGRRYVGSGCGNDRGIGLIGAAVFLIREHLAVQRDAQAVRDALAAGRPAWALDPLRRWLRARPASAEAHALKAEVVSRGVGLSRSEEGIQ